MQNTRLNTLFGATTERLGSWLRNPWRRLSVIIISVLLGNFLGIAIAAISGQRGSQDVVIAVILVATVEFIDLITYRSRPERTRSLLIEIANGLKIGLTYALFLEAFKLGS